MIQHQGFERLHAFKDWIIRDQSGRLCLDGARGLQRVRCPHAMRGANSGRDIGGLQIRGDPTQIGVGGQQAVELVDSLVVGVPVRLDEQLHHGDCGSGRRVIRPLHPREDGVGERHVPRIRLQLVNEDTGVQGDPLMAPQKRAEAGQSQLRRSF